MPDSFFASSKTRKRKRSQPTPSRQNGTKFKSKPSKPSKKPRLDEELSEHSGDDNDDNEWGGIQDMDLRAEEPDPNASDDEDIDETPAEKRLRLAQLYLDSVKESLADGEFDAAEIDKEIISSRLKQDVLSHSGKVHLFIADSYSSSLRSTLQPPPTLRTRGHRFSVTSAVTSSSAKYLYTSGKEGSIIKWDLITGKKLATVYKSRPLESMSSAKNKGKGKAKAQDSTDVQGHTDEILTIALSSDGKYLASGGRDRRLIIWDAETLSLLKIFQGPMNHKDTISALSFRHASHTLFTASFDRTIKLYDLTPSILGYTETLFGHQDSILSVSSLSGENCVSVGGRDKTARYWKIVEESQLVFRGGGRSRVREILEGGLRADDIDAEREEEEGKKEKKGEGYVEGSLECIAMIDESTFVTGGDSGYAPTSSHFANLTSHTRISHSSISLWSTTKKKPVFTQPLAHGLHSVHSSTEGLIQTPRWITALTALPYSDLFASGSWEGQIRLWKLDPKLKSFSLLGNVSIPGVVNSLQLVSPPKSFFTSRPQPTPASTSNPITTITTTAAASLPPASATGATPESGSSWLPHSLLHSLTSSSSTHILLSSPLTFIIAGTGQEHKFGRWLTVKEGAVNGAYVVALLPSDSDSAGGGVLGVNGQSNVEGSRTF
ncbi:hypothetical protein D9756_009857 [Leucocoprinus leucothites]|uniref:WD40 repeat-like protein n=1 Tax=Leucocoprinus leucothites TaxID=201217 RepID=A0A8H5FTW0_9AGAR|nr:hypothetical protein D9756_009857 [Leucoagaricus leucothites]